jgi:hypothetical protein
MSSTDGENQPIENLAAAWAHHIGHLPPWLPTSCIEVAELAFKTGAIVMMRLLDERGELIMRGDEFRDTLRKFDEWRKLHQAGDDARRRAWEMGR